MPADPLDDIRLDLRKVPRGGFYADLDHASSTLVVAFAGLKGFLGGFPAFEFRNTLSSVDVKSAFLRDHYSAWYHRGVLDVGTDIDAVVALLREFRSQADKMVMIGNSAGGYAALLFGSLLDCEAHAFSPQTFIDPDMLDAARDRRWDPELEALLASGRFDRRYGDLAPVIAASSGTFHVYHGILHPEDVAHAQHIRDLPNVTVHELQETDHRVVRTLRESGWLHEFLLGMAKRG
jgi:hypothetical protein